MTIKVTNVFEAIESGLKLARNEEGGGGRRVGGKRREGGEYKDSVATKAYSRKLRQWERKVIGTECPITSSELFFFHLSA